MQMFPDDLPLANIDADGYCCHFMRSSVRPTIHGLGFVYCIQSAWKKWPTIWHADVSRWLTLSIHWCLWILLLVCLSVHLSVCSFGFFFFFLLFFSIFFSKVRVGAKEGGSHYWEMAVAITCGYGGYLLPLLAAHSSYVLKMSCPCPVWTLRRAWFVTIWGNSVAPIPVALKWSPVGCVCSGLVSSLSAGSMAPRMASVWLLLTGEHTALINQQLQACVEHVCGEAVWQAASSYRWSVM